MKINEVVDVLKKMSKGESVSFEDAMDLLNTVEVYQDIDFKYSINEYLEGNDCDIEWDIMSEILSSIDDKKYFVTVEEYGGEGKGDEWYHVIKHVESGRFMECDGWYASYEGFNYDDSNFIEVKPVEVTVTKYVSL